MKPIQKTIKLFIDGKFPRTESGRSFKIKAFGTEETYAQVCQGSRKDLRNAVVAAQKAQPHWSSRTAFLRGQIIYRMAEMLQGKADEFSGILSATSGRSLKAAQKDVEQGIAELVYFAGFADKFAQVMSSLNPVSGPFHNFTAPEPMGVVGWIQDAETFVFADFIKGLAAVICSGNSVVAIMNPEASPILGVLGEVFATSDLPGGVVNLISCDPKELSPHLSSHMEIQGLAVLGGGDSLSLENLQRDAVENMKRVVLPKSLKPLEAITRFTEMKTVWHTIGV